MDPDLPFKSLVLFRATKKFKRSDIVLVDHPEYGPLVRKISAISVMSGRVGLRGICRSGNSARKLGNVDREQVFGKVLFRMNWFRVLPYFGPRPELEIATQDGSSDCAYSNATADCAVPAE